MTRKQAKKITDMTLQERQKIIEDYLMRRLRKEDKK